MGVDLISFVFELVPPLHAAFSRVLARCDISEAELFGLFLLEISPTKIEGRQALPASKFRDAMTYSMVYTKKSAASGVLGKLKDKGFVQTASVKKDQWNQCFPSTLGQKTAVFLEKSGAEKYQAVRQAAAQASSGFLAQLPEDAIVELDEIFAAASAHHQLRFTLARAFLHPPKKPPQRESADGPRAQDQEHA
jgi:hypothetical protein